MTLSISITGVDLDSLERQRRHLNDMLDSVSRGEARHSPEQIEALVSVCNMLDEWSDERYHTTGAQNED